MHRLHPAASLILFVVSACASQPAPRLEACQLPHARHGHRVERIAGGLLCFGGFAPKAGHDAQRQTWWLGPGARVWERRADMRRARSFFASVKFKGVVYAIGDGVERYDLADDRWETLVAAGTLPQSHFGAAVLGGQILVLGGYPKERSGCFLIDPQDGSVTPTAAPPGFAPGDHLHLMASLGGAVHVIGGIGGEPFTPRATHHVLAPDSDWQSLPPPPAGMWAKFGGCVVQGGAVFVLSDQQAWSFRPRTGWSRHQSMTVMLAMPALASVGERVWVLGGMVVQGRRGPRLEIYDLAHRRWVAHSPR